jgi:hypothetical protein
MKARSLAAALPPSYTTTRDVTHAGGFRQRQGPAQRQARGGVSSHRQKEVLLHWMQATHPG